MNRKVLTNRLYNVGYTLHKNVLGGWVVVSNYTGFEWKFPTLEGVSRFVTDEESLA